MGMFSILPDSLAAVETWVIRLFFFLATITVGPWLLFLLYDILLYLWRTLTYELPVVGGRARGRRKPEAPSLLAHPNGHRRQISLPSLPGLADGTTAVAAASGLRRRSTVSGSERGDGG